MVETKTNKEMAAEILIAAIQKGHITGYDQNCASAIAQAYKTIYQAVCNS